MDTFDYGATTITKRRRLPHYHVREGLYFITWRLHDAVPMSALAPLTRKRDGTELGERRYRAGVERLLDSGHGSCVLLRDDAASIVRDALAFFDNDRYSLIAWAIMPNHVHVILRLVGDHQLHTVVQSLKRYTARAINELLSRRGPLWQAEYFDTTLRSTRHLEAATTYVMSNPDKAGLHRYQWAGLHAGAYSASL